MKKVLEWCEHHRKDPPASQDDDSDSRKKSTDIDEWDQKFMQVDQEMLFEIILVRNPASLGLSSPRATLLHMLTAAGRQLPRHQGPPRCWLQDSRQHDQGQVAGRDPKDVQHPERLHSRGGGSDPPRERVGRGPLREGRRAGERFVAVRENPTHPLVAARICP